MVKKVAKKKEDSKSVSKKISKKENKKPVSQKLEKSLIMAEEEIDEIEETKSSGVGEDSEIQLKSSKPISQIKKGDKIKADALVLEVDMHYVLIDHGTTKEMTIECFDPKTDKDYQIRYFVDQVERTIELYKLEEIIYNRVVVKKFEW